MIFLSYRIHKPRDSILSLGSGFNKYGGLINWGGLLLFLGGMRLCLENFNKYGNRVDPRDWFYLLFGHIFENYQNREYPTIFLILCKLHTYFAYKTLTKSENVFHQKLVRQKYLWQESICLFIDVFPRSLLTEIVSPPSLSKNHFLSFCRKKWRKETIFEVSVHKEKWTGHSLM